ncbi:MAG TPA: twin-arginine translocase TatA/TatE family subunit [Pyrinomonadaceae bacterium]|jgi:TatA/E family protein of Tat protein translocase
MILLFLESLGTTELLLILVAALVLFGPRKLPEMSRKMGKALNDFRRAGDDFKRTWEREVAIESVDRDAAIDRAMVAEPPAPAQADMTTPAGEDIVHAPPLPARDITEAALAPVQGANIARGAHVETLAPTAEETTAPPSSRKTDWL